MSIDYTTYLGPYFECQVKKLIEQEPYRVCNNPDCGDTFERGRGMPPKRPSAGARPSRKSAGTIAAGRGSEKVAPGTR